MSCRLACYLLLCDLQERKLKEIQKGRKKPSSEDAVKVKVEAWPVVVASSGQICHTGVNDHGSHI